MMSCPKCRTLLLQEQIYNNKMYYVCPECLDIYKITLVDKEEFDKC